MLRYSLFAGPFGYGRDKTATRPRVRKHLIIIIPKNFLFKSIFYTRYIPFTSPFYLFSFLSLPAALPCRCDFPMRRYSVIRSSSTAPLTGSAMLTARGFARQPSQIEDDLSVPAVLRCRVGYSVQSPAVSLPFPHFPAVWPACKIYPDKEAGTASEKREEKV